MPARVVNGTGRGRFVILCDHASNDIPAGYRGLGLGPADLERHIAWDPGALPVAGLLAAALDAPLIHATVSRLVVDVNRSPDADDFIADKSEDTEIPGNRGLGADERRRRVAGIYEPYHRAIGEIVAWRERERLATALIGLHTFTPVYRGRPRQWHVGIIHDRDQRLAGPLIATLSREPGVVVGDNEPYSPADGVYHTLERHRAGGGLAAAMIEIRNDLVAGEGDQRGWAGRIARVLATLDLPARAA